MSKRRWITGRVLIEPFVGLKVQKYFEENQNKIDESSANLDLFKEEDIRQHDLFSIAFIILHTQVQDLPSVYQFYNEENKTLIKFDFEAFVAKIDAYFETLSYEDKFIKIIKKMVDYEGLKRSRKASNRRGGIGKSDQRAKPANDDFRVVDANGEQNSHEHEQPN